MVMRSAETLTYLKFKKIVQHLGLLTLIFCRPILPESLVRFLFFHLSKIKLEPDQKKTEKEFAICRYKYGARGALCVSIDFDLSLSRFTEILREATLKILQLAEQHNIRMSWGICGALAVTEPETFECVVNSVVTHDFGVHTFTHMDLSSPACSKDVVRDDILRCVNVSKRVRRPVTFIFPWNRVGYLKILRELGFITFRGNRDAMLTYPSKQGGLWDIHQTYYLTEKSVHEVNVILRLIDFAITYNSVLHIWSHPWNMTINGNVEKFISEVLNPLFSYTTQKRNKGSLWICTMRELANYCEAKEACRIEHIKKMKGKISFSAHCRIEDPRFDFPPTVTLRIRIPGGWEKMKVFIDDVEQSFTRSCFIVKRGWKRYLFLTLSFEKPFHEVYLIKANSR